MRKSIAAIMVMVVRLCGLTAAGTGLLFLFSLRGNSLLLHILPGALQVLALCVLVFQGWSLRKGLAAFALADAALIPLLGLLELAPLPGGLQGALRWLHPAVGIGGIALAELLAKQIRLHPSPGLLNDSSGTIPR